MRTLINPRPGWLVIRPEHLKYGGAVLLPENLEVKETLQRAVVVETAYSDVVRGDVVLYKTHAGLKLKLPGENLVLLGQYDVVGVIS